MEELTGLRHKLHQVGCWNCFHFVSLKVCRHLQCSDGSRLLHPSVPEGRSICFGFVNRGEWRILVGILKGPKRFTVTHWWWLRQSSKARLGLGSCLRTHRYMGGQGGNRSCIRPPCRPMNEGMKQSEFRKRRRLFEVWLSKPHIETCLSQN